jgi:NADH-quinone oxidoreductase subunit L
MTTFLAIGTMTMLLASTMAMVTRDIKQVWAYSTISQLGFMVMATMVAIIMLVFTG